MRLFEMSGGRRFVLLLLASIGAIALGILLSAALARPAGAATLPLPSSPTLPAPVGTSGGGTITDTVPSLPTTPVSQLPTAPLPVSQLPVSQLPVSQLPVPALPLPTLPLPELPVITMPASNTLISGILPAGTIGLGVVPGDGGPAQGSAVKLTGPAGRRTAAKSSRTGHSSTGQANGTAVRTPAPPVPSPLFPLIPSAAGDASAPGHGGNPWNALPLTVLLLALVAVGGVFLRRRLSLTHLFDSRLSPPG